MNTDVINNHTLRIAEEILSSDKTPEATVFMIWIDLSMRVLAASVGPDA